MIVLRRALYWSLTQLLPPACPLCRKTFPVAWQQSFCPDCMLSYSSLPDARCSCCALPFTGVDNSTHLCGRCIEKPPPFEKVYPVGCFTGSLREAVHRFKFSQQVGLDRILGQMLDNHLPADLDFDMLVPVPLHKRRLRQRSYNQSLLLAKELGRLRGLPVVADLLQKRVETGAQQKLSAKQRERNLRQVFTLQRKLQGERVLLVDDVMTTGATSRACSQALLDSGAAAVWVTVVGRA